MKRSIVTLLTALALTCALPSRRSRDPCGTPSGDGGRLA